MDIGLQVMKVFLEGHVTLYEKTGGGFGSSMGGKVVILTTTGRRSGTRHAVPLMAIRDGERYLVAASAGGDPKRPAWYHNLTTIPRSSCRTSRR